MGTGTSKTKYLSVEEIHNGVNNNNNNNKPWGHRPDGITLVPWQSGRAVAWDVTIVTTLADSYLPASSALAASAAEAAATRKEAKYADLPASFSFQPIAVETLGPINESAVDFLRELGRRISVKTNDERQTAFLFQRLSVTMQQFNAVILHDSFPTCSDLWPSMD